MEVQVSVLEAAWSASSVLEVSSSTSSSVLEVEVSVLEVVMQSVQVVHLGGGQLVHKMAYLPIIPAKQCNPERGRS